MRKNLVRTGSPRGSVKKLIVIGSMLNKRKYIRDRLKRGSVQTPHELASCYGKIRHSTYAAAKEAASKKPSPVRVYKCKHCDFYHIGKKRSV